MKNLKPEFYYEWGDEPHGFVSTGCYRDGQFYATGILTKVEATKRNLIYDCPFS